MTNKKMFWMGILAIVLVFGMTVVGCDDPSYDDRIIESWWQDDGPLNLTFRADNTLVALNAGVTRNYSYELQGRTLVLFDNGNRSGGTVRIHVETARKKTILTISGFSFGYGHHLYRINGTYYRE